MLSCTARAGRLLTVARAVQTRASATAAMGGEVATALQEVRRAASHGPAQGLAAPYTHYKVINSLSSIHTPRRR